MQPSEGSFDPHRGHNPLLRTAALECYPLQNPTSSTIPPSPTAFQMLSQFASPVTRSTHSLCLSHNVPISLFLLFSQPLSHTLQANSQPVSRHLQPSVPLAVTCALSATCIPSGGGDAALPARASWSQCSGTSRWLPKSTTEVFPPEVLASKCNVITVSFCLRAWDSGPCAC